MLMESARQYFPSRLKPFSTLVDKALRTDVQLLVMAMACLVIGWRERHRGSIGWLVPLAAMIATIPVELVMKRVVFQPPPGGLPLAAPDALSWWTAPYAFPSGAMTRTTVLLGWLGVRWLMQTGNLRWLWLPALGITLAGINVLFAISHWPTDVVGGVLLGAAAVSLAAALAPLSVLGAARRRAQG